MDKSTSRPQDFPFPRDRAKTLDSGQTSLPFSEDYPSIVSIRYELLEYGLWRGKHNKRGRDQKPFRTPRRCGKQLELRQRISVIYRARQ